MCESILLIDNNNFSETGNFSKQRHMAYRVCNWSAQFIKTKTHGMLRQVTGQCKLLKQKHMANKTPDWLMQK